MFGKRMLSLLACCAALACGPSVAAHAAPPWNGLISTSRVEADDEKEYPLGEENGPWMIMAASFSGDGARNQAHDLVQELRKRYKLDAYLHKVKFDLQEAPGRGVDRFGNPVHMRYRRGAEIEEFAVLVGNYPAVDDADAQKTLQKLKYTRPNCLDIDADKRTNQSLASWRLIERQWKSIGRDKKSKGPMGYAFVTTNPLLPKDYFVPNCVDELVLRMNKNVTHSLLDCPGKFSVQVAQFTGKVVLKQSEIKAIEDGKPMESALADAALKAHVLTEALRIKGYEAYEFHDRYASIVTVGSFDSVGTPRSDGKTEINPRIHAIMKTFGAQPVTGLANAQSGAMIPKKIGPLEGVGELDLDIQPMPVQVPKRSIAASLSRDGGDRMMR